MSRASRFKKGAASFYIVAIATLILVIVAASFAAVIISEITRTSNDDLAQSAYDSALAGVEDAKLAYYNYQSCIEGSSDSRCDEIKELVDKANDPTNTDVMCDMVASILEREVVTNQGVLVKETNIDNNMQQYYTCAILTTETVSLVGELNGSNPAKVMKAKFAGGVHAKDIASIRVSWQYSSKMISSDKTNDLSKNGIFSEESSMPPVISVGLVQTGGNFSLDSFDMTEGVEPNRMTNRGTVYLVPYLENDFGSLPADSGKYKKAEVGSDGEYDYIKKAGLLDSNDKVAKNLPYVVDCHNWATEEYACSAVIELPRPVGGGDRIDDTFMVVISLPYASSSTDISLEYICLDGTSGCVAPGGSPVAGSSPSFAVTKDTQITVDSTGKANDLYRRVKTVFEPADISTPYPLYAIQLLGSGSGSLIEKDLSPTAEWNF